MIDKNPSIIARCVGAGDVINTVKFARERDLLISLRGGFHSIAGHSTTDGGIVIDLSHMKGVHVDSSARTARAQAGLTWAEFDNETLVHGLLATTGGTVSNTGIAGLTLGGGLGWLMGKHGSRRRVWTRSVICTNGSPEPRNLCLFSYLGADTATVPPMGSNGPFTVDTVAATEPSRTSRRRSTVCQRRQSMRRKQRDDVRNKRAVQASTLSRHECRCRHGERLPVDWFSWPPHRRPDRG